MAHNFQWRLIAYVDGTRETLYPVTLYHPSDMGAVEDLLHSFRRKAFIANDIITTLGRPKEVLITEPAVVLRMEQANWKLGDVCELLSGKTTLADLHQALFNGVHGQETPLLIVELSRGNRRLEDLQALDVLKEMEKKRQAIFEDAPGMTPSASCKPRKYKDIQAGPTALLDGRYGGSYPNSAALPIEVLHPAFATFNAITSDLNHHLDKDILIATKKLMVAASQVVALETDRSETTHTLLSDLLNVTLHQTTSVDRSAGDYIGTYTRNEEPTGPATLVIVEEKAELGSSDDPAVKAEFSYLQHWSAKSTQKLANATSCPSFIVAIAGAYVCVLGAVITTHTIVNHLTDYVWIGGGRAIDIGHIYRVARIFSALRRAIHELTSYYADLPKRGPNSIYFSQATSYADESGVVHFRYLRPLKPGADSSCASFLARELKKTEGANLAGDPPLVDGERLFVVKFVERYGVEAHELLASHGKAPKLFYYGNIWESAPERHGCKGRKMVVMEYVKGQHFPEAPASAMREVLFTTVRILHDAGYVHGDIRMPNVLIKDGEGDADARILLLDFDWAGKEGEVHYPPDLSREIPWASGIEEFGLIKKEHDIAMIHKIYT
ncbi:hypothetical protein BD626DRAFT_271443 [Schizophyllum amplum]|uniref:Protein kinase domain-containing protein n=1 Tax=Schizophyllum amplum TaxID=97359 RepID=A0A550CF53_9AGAR|nr:hypothetical protein BD626DRAFT_271443 [Auriculariopsis ampla]